jgi:hypothetical protein
MPLPLKKPVLPDDDNDDDEELVQLPGIASKVSRNKS